MNIPALIRHFLLLLALVWPVVAAPPPNIIVMLIDDMGATDLGCYGSKFYQTPNIDKLAQDGMKFTRAYSACTVCSPTRAALMTSRYPASLHLTDWIAGHDRPAAKLRIPDWTKDLPASVPTLPQALKSAGYATCAIGKWHLSNAGPTAHGFDVSIADNGRGSPASYISPYKNPQLSDGPAGEFLSDRLTNEAEKFIEQNKGRPFFVYLPHFAVHTPLGGKPEVVAKYKDRATESDPQRNAVYAALVESVDDSVGRLRAKLAELKLSERTIFIFTSDNGGLLGNGITSNLGLRAGKGSAYEGGVRVPAIALVPGVTQPGSICATPVITMDWPATLLELAGAKPLAGAHGVSIAPLLRGQDIPPRPLFWHYPHYHPGGATPYSAMLEGGWRLVEFFEDSHVELYNLNNDPIEARDLASTQPERATAMRARLQAWRTSVDAQLPTPNPNYDPEKDAQRGKKNKPAK